MGFWGFGATTFSNQVDKEKTKTFQEIIISMLESKHVEKIEENLFVILKD